MSHRLNRREFQRQQIRELAEHFFLFDDLNNLGVYPTVLSLSLRGKHGVGRIDIVENRFIGMKSRGKT